MQTNMPREIKDIIRNVQQMDLPENGIADIRIKIQGGDVMDRPMFKKGGGANKFPDLSGDGKVTQKDILIGRGVIEKQEGGAVNPEQAISEVAAASEAEGEQLGLDYLAQQMGGIDMAEDAEGLINALRGNEMPISARRTELAEYVGEEDAMRTPESVLAMVQPTIMMTEEGAMNSGIGELMQQLTSDVEMATEGGAPTDMGQGVGALMMAGAPEQPVQQFAAGGAVQYFKNGTQKDPLTGEDLFLAGAIRRAGALQNMQNIGTSPGNLQTYFDEYLPLYENLIRDSESEEDRRKDRALALAKAGFRFASGVGPKGQNIAGQPLLSQAAAAAIPAIDELGDIESRRRKEDTALRTLAAQSAMKAQESATERLQKQAELEFTAGLSLQKTGLEQMLKGDEFSIVRVKTGENEETPLLLNKKTGETTQIDDFGAGASAVGLDSLPANLSEGKQISLLFQNLKPLSDGILKPTVVKQLDGIIDTLYPAEIVTAGVKKIPTVPVSVLQMLADRINRGEMPDVQERIIRQAQLYSADPQAVLESQTQTAIQNMRRNTEEQTKLGEVPGQEPLIAEGIRPEASYGLQKAFVAPLVMALTALEDELLGAGTLGEARSQRFRQFFENEGGIEALVNDTSQQLLQSIGGTRLAGELELITEQTDKLKPGVFRFEETARAAAKKVLVRLRNLDTRANKILRENLRTPGIYLPEDVQGAQRAKMALPGLIQAYTVLYESFPATQLSKEEDPRTLPSNRTNVTAAPISDIGRTIQFGGTSD